MVAGQVLGAVEEVMGTGDVEEDLVNGIDFQIRREPEADFFQSGADLGVLLVVPCHEDYVGAESLCLVGGHSRFDPDISAPRRKRS